jgi:N-acetylglutamate synthase-like GNAT family acetyltransferase
MFPPPPPPPPPPPIVKSQSEPHRPADPYVIIGIPCSFPLRSKVKFSKWLSENHFDIIFRRLDELPQFILERTAKLLNSFWPRSLEHRVSSLINERRHDQSIFSWSICAILVRKTEDDSRELTDDKGIIDVIGHARLLQAAQPSCAIVESVIVVDSFRGCGLGQQLMATVEQAAKKGNIDSIYLNTTDQQNFYESLGYRPCPVPLWSANGKKSILSLEDEAKLSSLFKGAMPPGASGGRQWMSKNIE